MPVPETARHDLYDGLVDLLGADRAGTLMAYVPSVDSSDIATKTDVAELVARVDRLMEMFLSSGRRLGAP